MGARGALSDSLESAVALGQAGHAARRAGRRAASTNTTSPAATARTIRTWSTGTPLVAYLGSLEQAAGVAEPPAALVAAFVARARCPSCRPRIGSVCIRGRCIRCRRASAAPSGAAPARPRPVPARTFSCAGRSRTSAGANAGNSRLQDGRISPHRFPTTSLLGRRSPQETHGRNGTIRHNPALTQR